MSSSLPMTSIEAPDQSSFYKPLPTSNSFRLLHFSHSSRSNEDNDSAPELECQLEVYEMGHHPPYRALSYTWGQPYYSKSPDEDEQLFEFTAFYYWIRCNRRFFRITKNLFNALTTLVNTLNVEYLWVDAICINQTDVRTERPQQVSLMGSIFESAEEVLIWLGHHISQVVDFHWSATKVVQVVEDLIDEKGETHVFSRAIDDDSFADLVGGYTSLKRVQEVMDFYGRCRVFNRAWIVQEFAKAAKPRLFCGNIEIPIEGLFRLGEWFGKTAWGFILEENDPSNGGIYITPYIRQHNWGRLRT